MRLAIIASHPVQYNSPLYRELAKRVKLTVYYGHQATKDDQARAGFDSGFEWDVELLSGYEYEFLPNRSKRPGLHHFAGTDTPDIGTRLRNSAFDAVVLMGWFLKSYHQALWAAKLQGVPVLVRGDSHLDTPRSFWKRFGKQIAYPGFLRLFDGALVVGKRNWDYWRHYHYPESRMFTAPHCVDNEWFASRSTASEGASFRERRGIPRDTKVVLFAGKLVAFKRPLDVIRAVSLMKNLKFNAEILIAGSGPLEREIVEAANSSGVRLHLLGFCNQSEMPAVYAAADLLVLPSDGRESWGLVVNEALACGKPVVVSDTVGCAPDIAAHLSKRILYPLGNTDALARCIDRSITDPPSRDILASVAAQFSLEAACHGIENAIGAVSQRKHSRK